MNTFEAFREYQALKAHFTSEYNYIKYNGKMKSITPVTLDRNKQKYLFEKLAKMKDPQGYLIANFLKDRIWIGDMFSSEGEKDYKAWKKRIDSLDYSLMEEVKKFMGERPDEAMSAHLGHYPKLFRDYIKGDISIELIMALDVLTMKLLGHWNKNMEGDPL